MANPFGSAIPDAPLFSPTATVHGAVPDVRPLLASTPDGPTPLGFVLPAVLATPARHVLSWSPPAAGALGQLSALLRPGALPTRSLATLAELHLPGLQRLDARMGAAYGDQRGELAWSNVADRPRLLAGATAMMDAWITGALAEIGRARAADAALQAALRDLQGLHARGALFAVHTLPAAVHTWGASANGTARPGSDGAYPALADAVAGALHGHELLPGSGVMRRVVPRHAQGHAELIGAPVQEGDGAWTIQVVRVRVLSLPGHSRPLVALEVYRKCWETSPGSQLGNTTGYVLSEHAAHAFTLSAGISPHSVNSEYPVLARAYGLDEHTDTAPHCGDRVRVYVQERGSDGRLATASVPEHDRIAVLRGAAAPLAPLGLVPWTGVREVKAPGSAPEVVLGFTALPLGPSGQGRWAALAFRLCLHTGRVEACVGREDPTAPHQLQPTSWEPLTQVQQRLTGTQPVTLNADTGQAQFQAFIDQTVQGELEAGRAPLVVVDSTHAVGLWPWLADSRIDPQRIEFAQLNRRDLQDAWGRAGVRLVRVRQNNAPPVSWGGPARGTSRLLRVEDARIPTYLACGAAPRPVELSVLLTQPGDDADRLAGFVGRLIGGGGDHGGPWLPTPLCPEDLPGVRAGDAQDCVPNTGSGE
ncbi:RNaseH domain-containing protein [Deinococcus aerophilus]|uniref:Uncharacterized protein n=1 Tax=Deinococcus aerophilus TaxID=522488 RepID=A0ABQ2GXG7_9DEIO|nr:RNaseH domain-containing protein [Deinococcus aerophilus]GGM16616.1 hypothetical protein GCM10010841_26160 [Deinococcus aerophilus]